MASDARRKALIIASSEYDDEHFGPLPGSENDAVDLARVLSNPQVGDFEVQSPLVNRSHTEIRRATEVFFRRCDRHDLLLLYLSCHGFKDNSGELYFAAVDTEREFFGSTAISSHKIRSFIKGSPANRQILILDCCYSGAFTSDVEIKGDETVDLWGIFQQQGKGQVVLAASNAIQEAFQERARAECPMPKSLFTRVLIEGLETGKADENDDGQVSMDELYRYIWKRFKAEDFAQAPCKWGDVEGELFIAYSPKNRELFSMYKRANEEREKGRLSSALNLLKQIATVNPDYRNVAQQILDLQRVREAEKIAIENQALLIGLDDDPVVVSYVDEAKLAGLNVNELPRMTLGSLLERVIHLIVDRAVRDAAEDSLPDSTDICSLLSYLAYDLFTTYLTACDVASAIRTLAEALKMQDLDDCFDVAGILDWLKGTYWLREVEDGQVAFRDDYARLPFTAMYLRDLIEDTNDVSVLWMSGVAQEPNRWKEVIVLMEGMLSEDRAVELLEALLEENLPMLAGLCIAKGQPLPQSIVSEVVEALITQTGEERQ